METPSQPPEARVIDAAQKAAVPKLSIRKAAERAGISEGRWRQIVKGYQGTGTGRLPVVAPDETIARMALAVGVTDSQLGEAGRPQAAEVLRQLLATSEQPDVELTQVSTDRLLGEIRRRIEGVGDAVEDDAESRASSEAIESQKNLVDRPEDRWVDEAARLAAAGVAETPEEQSEVK